MHACAEISIFSFKTLIRHLGLQLSKIFIEKTMLQYKKTEKPE
jgi:hypothetical protein